MQTTGHNAIIIDYTLFGFQPFNEPLSLRVGGTEPKFEICLMFKLNIYIWFYALVVNVVWTESALSVFLGVGF